ncbi:head decoration protein [Quatrionicoccus australiensis]|uniref:head decoration protein n=1 Tax=Quatrionicoccus australiensis TaxID=138118 RepID=UPI001CF85F30|nr:head decoration protein [Quatrionicoccus australiensis]UCV16724.1 head decoration protein [Quatrionicoccus australiensis]
MYSQNNSLSDVLLYEVLPKWSSQAVTVAGFGGTDVEVIVGDEVEIRVSVEIGTVLGKITATGVYVPLDLTNNDGSQNAAAILAEDLPISAATCKAVVIKRGAGVNSAGLVWPGDITTDQKTAAIAQLEAHGIDVVSVL